MRILEKVLPLIHSIHYKMRPDRGVYVAKISFSTGGLTVTKRIEAESYTDFNLKLTDFYACLDVATEAEMTHGLAESN